MCNQNENGILKMAHVGAMGTSYVSEFLGSRIFNKSLHSPTKLSLLPLYHAVQADLSAAAGDLVVIEYSEERPPLLMTKGMTCRIVNYYRGDRSRCPISAGGGDRPLRKRHGDKAASAATSNAPTSGPSNRVERPPRLVGPNQYVIKSAADLIGISSIKKKKKSKEAMALEAKKAKENAIDVLPGMDILELPHLLFAVTTKFTAIRFIFMLTCQTVSLRSFTRRSTDHSLGRWRKGRRRRDSSATSSRHQCFDMSQSPRIF